MDRCRMRVPGHRKLCLALGLALALAGDARAATVGITSFENGELVPGGGDTIGMATTRPQLFGVGPTNGSRLFVVNTRENQGATNGAAIESAMGIPSGTIDTVFSTVPSSSGIGPTNGSAFRITFSALAGDELSFDWNFVTAAALPLEPLSTDFGWSHLAYEGMSLDETNLGNANTGPFSDTNNNNYDQTGWQTLSMTLPSSGSYTLSFGVMDVQDTAIDSYLMIDWLRITRSPEPGTAALLGLGLLGLAWHGRVH